MHTAHHKRKLRISWSICATTYCYLKCIACHKLLKPRQSLLIALCYCKAIICTHTYTCVRVCMRACVRACVCVSLRLIVRNMSIKQCRNQLHGMLSSTIPIFLFFRLRLNDYVRPQRKTLRARSPSGFDIPSVLWSLITFLISSYNLRIQNVVFIGFLRSHWRVVKSLDDPVNSGKNLQTLQKNLIYPSKYPSAKLVFGVEPNRTHFRSNS
jgi:hypothetical protein